MAFSSTQASWPKLPLFPKLLEQSRTLSTTRCFSLSKTFRDPVYIHALTAGAVNRVVGSVSQSVPSARPIATGSKSAGRAGATVSCCRWQLFRLGLLFNCRGPCLNRVFLYVCMYARAIVYSYEYLHEYLGDAGQAGWKAERQRNEVVSGSGEFVWRRTYPLLQRFSTTWICSKRVSWWCVDCFVFWQCWWYDWVCVQCIIVTDIIDKSVSMDNGASNVAVKNQGDN